MNTLKTTFLLTALTLLLLFFGKALGGNSGMMFALVMAGVMNFVSYRFSDKIVLKMYGAKEVTEGDAPRLYGITRQLAVKAMLPIPKVYIIPGMSPNAFATGRNPQHAAVAATEGILKMLNDEELEGVMAHELAHVGNRDILISSIVATIAGAISYLAHMAQWAAMFGSSRNDERGGNPIALIAMMIIAPLAAMIIQMAISRSREYGADEGGARITGNPLSLANALRKLEYGNKRIPMAVPSEATAHMFIVSPLSGGSFLKLFSTHPPIEERIKRLEAMAGAPRY